MKVSLRKNIEQVQHMEYIGFKKILLTQFITKLNDIFETATSYTRKASFDPNNVNEDREIPYSDIEAGKTSVPQRKAQGSRICYQHP